MKRILLMLTLVVVILPLSGIVWLMSTESGLHWVTRQAQTYLPGSLEITGMNGRLAGPISIEHLSYRYDDLEIKINQARLDWTPAALLGATVKITQFHLDELEIFLPEAEQDALPELSIPWRVALSNTLVSNITLHESDKAIKLKQIRLDASTLLSELDINEFYIASDDFHVNINGQLKTSGNFRHKLKTSWQAKLPSGKKAKGSGHLKGDISKTSLHQMISGPVTLTLNAELRNILEQFNWDSTIDIARYDTSLLIKDWPSVSGKLSAKASGGLKNLQLHGMTSGHYSETGPFDSRFDLHWLNHRLQINQFDFQTAQSNILLNSKGQWQPGPDGGEVALDIDWKNLRWPIKTSPWFNSATGTGSLQGSLNDYRLEITTDNPLPQAPPSTWYAHATGNLSGMDFHTLRINMLDGVITTTGQLNWKQQFNWHASHNAKNINPGLLWPQWPGSLSAQFGSKGRIENGQLIAETDIQQLAGKMREYPVNLSGKLGLHDNTLKINSLDIQSGKSVVALNGTIAKTIDIKWSITSPNINELYPSVQGGLNSRGRLKGDRQAPVIEASVDGTKLSIFDYKIGTVQGNVNVDLFQWQDIAVDVAMQALDFQDYTLKSVTLQADNQQLALTVSSESASARIEAQGQARDNTWHGTITAVDIDSARYGDWQLAKPAGLVVNKKVLALETLCLNSNATTNLCTTLRGSAENWHSTLDANNFPLRYAERWLPPDIKLKGMMNASAKFDYQTAAQITGMANIELPPGELEYPLLEGEYEHWPYQGGNLNINVDHLGLNADGRFIVSENDHLQAQLKLPGVKLLDLKKTQPIEARAQVTLQSLGVLEALISTIQNVNGELQLDLHASGTFTEPRFSGKANLNNGSLIIPRLGLSIEQIQFNGTTDGTRALNYRLDARSGEGMLTARGQTSLNKEAGWPSEIIIEGNDFEVSRIPEARVLINPDLKITLASRTINVSGNLHIPYAKLQPKDITTAARVSGDTVIISGDTPVTEKWSIFTKLRLSLGERVSFYGYGFEGRFGGNLLLEDEPGQPTTATGEITVPEGQYRAYGQRLDVENGRLLYTGGPLSNPGLDLRAVRRTGDVTAGLLVKGTLNQPQIELFSIPAMGQTDALAYLLLGRPMESASDEEGAMMAEATLALGLAGGDFLARSLGDRFGLDVMRVETSDTGDQASLVMGRYLSPRLYISYGVGLLEAINTLGVRYKISDKWQLKGESGEHHAADILFTLER